MLPASHRLRDSEEFGSVVRRGTRAGRPTLVAHVLLELGEQRPTKVGFVVSKAVGNAVQRNLVKRRLRAAMWDALRPGALFSPSEGSASIVVRALPPAARSPFAELQRDLEGALRSAASKATPRVSGHA